VPQGQAKKEEGLNWRLAERHKHESNEREKYMQVELRLRGNERRINGSHFLLTLGYEHLKQNWEHIKEICMVYHNV